METDGLKEKKQIGERIKSSRKACGYTQLQTAEILHMTQQQYSRFENGIFELNYAQLKQICRLFDVSSDYILGISEY